MTTSKDYAGMARELAHQFFPIEHRPDAESAIAKALEAVAKERDGEIAQWKEKCHLLEVVGSEQIDTIRYEVDIEKGAKEILAQAVKEFSEQGTRLRTRIAELEDIYAKACGGRAYLDERVMKLEGALKEILKFVEIDDKSCEAFKVAKQALSNQESKVDEK